MVSPSFPGKSFGSPLTQSQATNKLDAGFPYFTLETSSIQGYTKKVLKIFFVGLFLGAFTNEKTKKREKIRYIRYRHTDSIVSIQKVTYSPWIHGIITDYQQKNLPPQANFFIFSTAKRMATSVQGAVEREVFKGDWYEASA